MALTTDEIIQHLADAMARTRKAAERERISAQRELRNEKLLAAEAHHRSLAYQQEVDWFVEDRAALAAARGSASLAFDPPGPGCHRGPFDPDRRG